MESSEYFMAGARQADARRPARSYDESSLAGLGLRCSAFLLDYILTLLIPAVTLVLAVYIKRRWMASSAANVVVVIGYLVTAAVIFFNYVHFYVQRGQSFGKRFIGIRVVRTDGEPITHQTAVLRHIVGYPLSILFFGMGMLWMLWDGRQQGWHDKLVKTIVVKD
ncbi:MAG: RDD family protein [Blastocatellales bacterium]